MKKIITAISFAVFANSGFAGGGAGTGATEITQMMNNAELVSSVAQQANLNATAIQQYITQYKQLDQMYKMAQQMDPAAAIAAQTPYSGQIAKYTQAYQATSALGASAARASDLMAVDLTVMQKLGMTPTQYYTKAAEGAKADNEYWRSQLQTNQAAIQDLQGKSRAVNDLAARNPDITTEIGGFQHLAAQNAQMSQALIEMSADMKQLLAIEQAKAGIDGSRRGAAADAAREYNEGRQAEQMGLEKAFSYPATKSKY